MEFAFEGAHARGEPTLATTEWRPPSSQAANRAWEQSHTGQLIAPLHCVSFVHVLVTAKGELRCCSIKFGGQENAPLVLLSLQTALCDNSARPLSFQ